MNALRSEQEQDEANCLEWLARTPPHVKELIWDKIQAMGGDHDTEVISRFAQLGMTHAVLLEASQRGERP